MPRFRTLLLLLAPTLPTPLAAQSPAITLRAGTLLDGRGGRLTDVDLTIENGRITAVGPAGAGMPALDFSRATVMPGLIDTHVHLNWHFDPDGRTHHRSRDEESEAEAALYEAENGYATLMGGVTTVQSLGSPLDGPFRDAVARGILPGPRVLTSLGALSGRSGPPATLRQRVRELEAAGADAIKIFASASIRVGGAPTMSVEQLEAVCGEATRLGLRTAVHAHGPESARRAVLAGCTSIEHGALLDRATLELMAEHGTWYDPNIGLIFANYLENKPRFLGIGNYTEEGFAAMERAVPRALAVFKEALTVPGLGIVFGTDAVAGAHGRNLEELVYRVEQGGQDPMAAIVSATSTSARALGLDGKIGVAAPGFRADLIALDGDPSRDIAALRRVAMVMREGRVVGSR